MVEITTFGFVIACVLAFVGGTAFGFVGAFHLAGYLCAKWSDEEADDEG